MKQIILMRTLQPFQSLGFALAAVVGTFPAAFAMVVGAAALMPAVARRGQTAQLRALLHQRALLETAFITALCTAAGASAVVMTDMGVVAFLGQTTPMFAIMFAPLYREKVTRHDLAALAVAMTA